MIEKIQYSRIVTVLKIKKISMKISIRIGRL